MQPRKLSRSELCCLTDLSFDDLKNRNRRRQLPFPDNIMRRGKYSHLEALSLIMVRVLAESDIRSSLSDAADIVGLAKDHITSEQLAAVAETSLAWINGLRPEEILLSIIWSALPLPFAPTDRNVEVGTFREISEAILAQKHRRFVRQLTLNATRAAVLLRERASHARIEIGDLFMDAD